LVNVADLLAGSHIHVPGDLRLARQQHLDMRFSKTDRRRLEMKCHNSKKSRTASARTLFCLPLAGRENGIVERTIVAEFSLTFHKPRYFGCLLNRNVGDFDLEARSVRLAMEIGALFCPRQILIWLNSGTVALQQLSHAGFR
jgi:hypothetical protein